MSSSPPSLNDPPMLLVNIFFIKNAVSVHLTEDFTSPTFLPRCPTSLPKV